MRTEPERRPPANDTPSPLSLRRGFSWTLAANVGFAACQWGMLIVLARLGSPAVVGEYALALAVTAPISLLAGLSLRTVQATDARSLFRFADYVGLRSVTMVLTLPAIAAVVIIAGYGPTAAAAILVVGVGKGIASLMDIYHGFFQRHRAMNLIARSVLMYGLLSLAGLALGFWLTGSVAWAALGSALGALVTLLVYDVPVARRLRRVIVPAESEAIEASRVGAWARLAWLGLPLGLSAGLVSLAVNVPRYAVEASLGEASLGIFAALAYFMVAGNTVISALAESALPVLADRYADGDGRGFRALLGRLLGVGAVLALVGLVLAALWGPALVEALYGPEYARHRGVLLWLVAATGIGFIGWFLDAAISAARRFRMHLLSNAGLMAVMVFGAMVVIPVHGLDGAAWVVAGAMGVQTLLRLGIIAHVLRTMDPERPARDARSAVA